eukprot:TRINITY_DN10823_c0_g1_i1.p1 TRINITY_DN10823_c0_g1~~TRINITY_DN10823_c0_g1_i1.p1  ORF type:complete len:194 (+),score=31.51 TRINITY_DN10823_c0_g1_i1:783-1364(+)
MQILLKWGALNVTLKRGDVLFIPPLWAHHVTNIDAGISVNVWSDADYYDRMTSNFGLVDKVQVDTKSINEAYLKGIHTITAIIQSAGLDVRDWIEDHFYSRYEKLFYSSYFHSGMENEQIESLCEALSGKNIKYSPDFLKNEQAIIANVKQIPEHVRYLHIGDLVDIIAYGSATKFNSLDAKNTLYFVRYCFL